jgi:Arc/MetJ family transcription regulator
VIADVGLKIEVANTPTLRIWVYMRTNIDLDETLVTRGLQLSGLRTKKDLVNMALREFIRKNDQKKILELRGKIQWQGDLDLMRQSRV